MFRRIVNLFKAFINLFISGLEKRNPEALLELEQENLRKKVAEYNQGLAQIAGLPERLKSQEKKLDTEERELTAKITANIKAGNKEIAGQYALRLQTVKQQLAETRTQSQDAETKYKHLIKARDFAITEAKAKIEAIRSSLADAKIQKAMAEMNEMAAGLTSSIGSSGDTLDRLHGIVEDERQKAAGKARVAHDSLYTQEVEMKEAEKSALADAALADFMNQQGLSNSSQKTANNPVLDKVVESTIVNKEQTR